MSVEELGQIADLAREYVYSDWVFYQFLKDSGQRGKSETFKIWFRMCELVERCYGPKPDNWDQYHKIP